MRSRAIPTAEPGRSGEWMSGRSSPAWDQQLCQDGKTEQNRHGDSDLSNYLLSFRLRRCITFSLIGDPVD